MSKDGKGKSFMIFDYHYLDGGPYVGLKKDLNDNIVTLFF